MKKIIILFLLMVLAVHGGAQQLVVDSTRFIAGNNFGDDIYYALATADHGLLLVGNDYGNPGGIIPYFPLDTGDNGNVLIVKLDSNRQISCVKVYGGSNADAGTSAVETPDGGFAILAGTASGNGDVTGYKGGGGDIWLLKLDAVGNLLWEKTYGSMEQDAPVSITNTPDNGLIMLGITYGSDGDVPFHYGGAMTDDWLVVKTDSMGNKQWSKDLGGTNDEYPGGSILSVDNSYYIVSGSAY